MSVAYATAPGPVCPLGLRGPWSVGGSEYSCPLYQGYRCLYLICFAGRISRKDHLLVRSRFVPDPRRMAIRRGGAWIQGRGKRGEASGARVGPHGIRLYWLMPLHAFHGVLFGRRAGHSVCPAVLFPMTMTYAGTLRPGTRGKARQVTLFRAHRKRVGNRGAL